MRYGIGRGAERYERQPEGHGRERAAVFGVRIGVRVVAL
jgi:hypothetical protein